MHAVLRGERASPRRGRPLRPLGRRRDLEPAVRGLTWPEALGRVNRWCCCRLLYISVGAPLRRLAETKVTRKERSRRTCPPPTLASCIAKALTHQLRHSIGQRVPIVVETISKRTALPEPCREIRQKRITLRLTACRTFTPRDMESESSINIAWKAAWNAHTTILRRRKQHDNTCLLQSSATATPSPARRSHDMPSGALQIFM